ncbi:hypothetical protein [Sphingomonas kyeonggiensis]|nr:hypothetical protein [Sphingomonas kyeonggiensis]
MSASCELALKADYLLSTHSWPFIGETADPKTARLQTPHLQTFVIFVKLA